MRSILLLLASAAVSAATPVLIGTRTNGESKGIYAADFDDATGKLSDVRLVAEAQNPGFLALHPDKPVVYATGKNAAAAYSYEKDGSLKLLNSFSTQGTNPCHLEVAPGGNLLAVANYGDGTLSWFPLAEDGSLKKLGAVIQFEGSGAHPQRQTAPHAHGAHFLGNLLAVPDLGTDRVMLYRTDGNSGLTPSEPAFVKTQPGDGPRHLTFSPDGKFAFAIHELSSVAEAYRVDGGKLTSTARATTLPEGWKGQNTTAEIEVDPTGKWVLASNRGHDSIAVFRFNAKDGSLEPKAIVPSDAKIPRHFKIAPGGRWVLVAGQDSNDIHVFRFDPETGELQPTENTGSAPSPICVLFLPVDA